MVVRLILSPSKSLNFAGAPTPPITTTTPIYATHADALASSLSSKPASYFTTLLKTSATLSAKTAEQFSSYSSATPLPCIYAFSGSAYDKLLGRSLSSSGLSYAQETLRIFDPLYGYLKAMDGIKPYRMELLVSPNGERLDRFWEPKVTEALNAELGEDHSLLFDLAR